MWDIIFFFCGKILSLLKKKNYVLLPKKNTEKEFYPPLTPNESLIFLLPKSLGDPLTDNPRTYPEQFSNLNCFFFQILIKKQKVTGKVIPWGLGCRKKISLFRFSIA